MYGSIFSSIGSNSVFISHLYWDKADLRYFRVYCLVIAFFAFVGFQYTAYNLKEKKTIIEEDSKDDDISLKTFANQLLRQTNFWLFVAFNLIQVFNCHFNSNFLSIFMEHFLVPSQTSQITLSTILSLAAILPHVLVIFLASYEVEKIIQVQIRFLCWIEMT